MKNFLIAFSLFIVLAVLGIVYFEMQKDPKEKEIFISFSHIGDIHGHLLPREHLREGDRRYMEGGLARLYTIVNHLRERDKDMILINTGDTIQGSAEALFTQGQAVVDILNEFGINYYAPGNWDWVYGKKRFEELFLGQDAKAKWNPLISNVYDSKTGELIAEPYKIQTVKGIKIGFIGFSSERGPMVVGDSITKGLTFSDGSMEFKKYVHELRPQVDVLVVLSELGLAKNIALAKETSGVDFIFSSDMHEETGKSIQLPNGTVLMEEGQDGTRLGELNILLKDHKLLGHKFKMHKVNRNIPANRKIQSLIEKIRAPFLQKHSAQAFINPFSKRPLKGAIDEIIGESEIALHRSNYSDTKMAAVIEGSSHDFLTDAFRVQSGADIGLIRGFRYGTTVKKGPIRREDIYHYIPIGPFISVGELSGSKIKGIIEDSADGSLSKSSYDWKGGWLFGWSGLHFSLNPYDLKGARISDISVLDKQTQTYLPLEMDKMYTVASYNYDEEPELINKIKAQNVKRLTNDKDEAIDATEVVEDYLKKHKANPEQNRIKLLNMLPASKYGNKEIQPLP